VHVWPRNSLFQNYFGFLKSDLDLTFLFSQNDFFLEQAKKVRAYLMFFPLVKEANYYSLEQLSHLIKFINFYELKRDPILFDYTEEFKPQSKTKSEAVVYLMRTFMSNQRGFTKASNRDLLKWKYHLELTEHNTLSAMLPSKSLKMILEQFFQSNTYYQAFDTFLQGKEQNIPDHISFDQNQGKKELFVLLPYMFSYKEVVYSWSFSPSEIDFILAQISWETWAMFTQIDMFLVKSQSQEHLNNINKFLNSLLYKELSPFQRQLTIDLIVSIDEWLRL